MAYIASPEHKRRGRGLGPQSCRGPLAVLAGLVTLAAVGCGGPASTSNSPHGGGAPGSPGGAANPFADSGGVVDPSATRGTPVAAGEPLGTGQRSGVLGGSLFGGDVPLASQTGRLGRRLAIVRTYYVMGEQFPTRRDKKLMAVGSTMLVSLDAAPRQHLSFASIAAGQHDTTIKRFLGQVEQAAITYHLGAIYIDFEHEVNGPNHRVLGSAAEFVRAWDHIHQLAASAHLDWNQGGRLHWVLILTHEAYIPMGSRPRWAYGAGAASSFWPGNNEVDIVAADGYNSGSCRRSARSSSSYVDRSNLVVGPQQLFGSVLAFARAEGNLPVFIAEWGSVPYSSLAGQAGFINQMQGFVTANHEIAAALYWNSRVPGCNYSLNSQPTALAALAAMAHAPGMQGHIDSS